MDSHQLNQPILTESIDHVNHYDFSQIHRHSYFEIMLFEKGSGVGVNAIDFIDYPIPKNGLPIIAPNQVHLMKRKQEDNGIVLQFTKEYLLTNTNFHVEWLFSLQSNPMTILAEQQFNKLYPLFVHLNNISREKSSFSTHVIRHYFFYIIFHVLEMLNSKVAKKVSSNAIIFLGLAESQFKENRTVANYAQQMNIAVKKLNTDIKNSFGKTPLQLIHDLLAIEIKRLILVENLSHKEIAYDLSFDSPASYTRFVKKHFNCKPTELKAHSN